MDRNVEYWTAKRLIEEEMLITSPHGLETRVNLLVGQVPFYDSGGAIFRGVFGGLSMVADVGVVTGRDSLDLYTMVFYTPKGVRVWAETYDTDAFMDSLAYLGMRVNTEQKVIVGGVLNQEGIPELKMEYLRIDGPTERHEDRLLAKEYMIDEGKLVKVTRLRRLFRP